MATQSTSDPHEQPWMAEPDQTRSRSINEVQRQLNEAQLECRRLSRELRKEQARHAETTEAYTKTVNNMVDIARENALLSHELQRLRRNTPRASREASIDLHGINITASEAKAIRKAMARLHHPDVGGNEQRMKVWNAVLDLLDDD